MGVVDTLMKKSGALPWELWTRQIQGILRLELKRNFLTFRSFFVYLLALTPVLIVSVTFLVDVFHSTLGGGGRVVSLLSSSGPSS